MPGQLRTIVDYALKTNGELTLTETIGDKMKAKIAITFAITSVRATPTKRPFHSIEVGVVLISTDRLESRTSLPPARCYRFCCPWLPSSPAKHEPLSVDHQRFGFRELRDGQTLQE